MDVVYIEDRKGPHGGEYWFLTLSCGHHITKGKPKFHVALMLAPLVKMDEKSERAARERRLRLMRGAPKQAKCLLCKK